MNDEGSAIEKLKDQVRPAIRREVDQLFEVLESSDKLVPLVLRFHLLSEYHLERIIVSALPRGDRLIEKAGLTYSQKLFVVSSLDILDDKIVTSLKHLDSLRNKCSHERDVTISISDIEKVGRPLGAEFTKLRSKYGDSVLDLAISLFPIVYIELISETTIKEFPFDLEAAKSDTQDSDA